MKRSISAALTCLALVVLSVFLMAPAAPAGEPSYGMPATFKPDGRYLFFHHNYYVETKGTEGDCKYYDILKTFGERGFTVISEIRPKDASPLEFAKKAAAQVKKALDAGVPPGNIVVAGHSKGGVITLQVASLLEKPEIRYVVMAGCDIKGLAKAYPDSARLKGNFLSVYASSDKIAGSCTPAFAQAKDGFTGKEMVLENAAGHQLFFKPADVWVEPVMSWLKGAR